MKSIFHEHINELHQKFWVYFTVDDYLYRQFSVMNCQTVYKLKIWSWTLTNELIELLSELVQKAKFKSFKNYKNFGITSWSSWIPWSCSKSYLCFVHMPAIYLCEQGFSALFEIKSKKKTIKDVDMLTIRALETRLTIFSLLTIFSQFVDEIQQQHTH